MGVEDSSMQVLRIDDELAEARAEIARLTRLLGQSREIAEAFKKSQAGWMAERNAAVAELDALRERMTAALNYRPVGKEGSQ